MAGPNTQDADAVAGAMYFIVGRGTEGGPNSYRLSVAGVNSSDWGTVQDVAANSGYSIGTIQVDLGQRGTWAVGKTTGPAGAGETTYVDAIINESSAYAKANGLSFPTDTTKLRADLLTHGNGLRGRSSISFIDAETRDSINAWASSSAGEKWIHSNVDYPQVRDATAAAMSILKEHGAGITDEHRLASIALLTKTANQFPAQLPRLQAALDNGGDYQALIAEAGNIGADHRVYDGLKAVAVAEKYQAAFADATVSSSIERAQRKVSTAGFDPSTQAADSDIATALTAIGQGARNASPVSQSSTLRLGAHGDQVSALQSHLASLGMTDEHGRALVADGRFGPATKAAVEQFQAAHGLAADGAVGPRTVERLDSEVERNRRQNIMSLSDERHPGVSMYTQALAGVRSIDQQLGRQTDQSSRQLAGALAVGACAAGFNRVDHVVMSDDGSRAYAVQGQLNSPFKQYTDIDVARAVTVPLEQSGAQFLQASQQRDQQVALDQQARNQTQSQEPQAAPQHPAMSR